VGEQLQSAAHWDRHTSVWATIILLLLVMVTARSLLPVRSLGHHYQSGKLLKHGDATRSDEVYRSAPTRNRMFRIKISMVSLSSLQRCLIALAYKPPRCTYYAVDRVLLLRYHPPLTSNRITRYLHCVLLLAEPGIETASHTIEMLM